MERLIILVSVDRYRRPEHPLPASVRTMQAYAAYFASEFGGQASTIVTLADADANRGRVRRELRKHATKFWSEVIFVFIGHGAPEGIGLIDGLMPYGDLAEALGELPTLHPLVILDTCHAGGAFTAFGGLDEPDLRDRMLYLLRAANPALRVLAAVPADASTWQIGNQSVFSQALLAAAVSAASDMPFGAVSAARVFGLAAQALVAAGYRCPTALGPLVGFPFGFSDVLKPFGSAIVGEGRRFDSHAGFWNRNEWHVELRVLLIDRAGVPVTVQHFVHDGRGTTFVSGPQRSLIATRSHEVMSWYEPLAGVPFGECSTVLVYDERGRFLARHDSWSDGGFWTLPMPTLPAPVYFAR